MNIGHVPERNRGTFFCTCHKKFVKPAKVLPLFTQAQEKRRYWEVPRYSSSEARNRRFLLKGTLAPTIHTIRVKGEFLANLKLLTGLN